MGTVCYHCHLPISGSPRWHALIDGRQQPMCCPGCQAVATAIVAGGLANYYDYRTAPAQTTTSSVLEQYQLYDRQDLQQGFVQALDDHQCSGYFLIEGITCSACIWLLEHHLDSLAGVMRACVNLSQQTATIVYEKDVISVSDIMLAIFKVGYRAHPWRQDKQNALQEQEHRQFIRRLAVAGLGAMQVMMYAIALYTGGGEEFQGLLRGSSALLATPVVFYAAQPFFLGAWRSLSNRHLSMDVPVALAIGSAYLASLWNTWYGGPEVYFDSVSMFTFFLLVGRYLEMRARRRISHLSRSLASVLPERCTRITADNHSEYTIAADLKIGDKIRVLPGDSIPADGVVFHGQSCVDESIVTGESMPVPRNAGDTVIAGSLNRENTLLIEVTHTGEDTRLSAISRLVNQATMDKPDIVRITDRIAGWFVGCVLLISIAVYCYWSIVQPAIAFETLLAVLVATCPCALSLATPAALTTVTGYLQGHGFIVRRGHVIEGLTHITHVVFDKTGTLTQGRLTLSQVQVINNQYSQQQALAIAAGLESYSEHPIARAFPPSTLSFTDINNQSGAGLEGYYDGQLWRIGIPHFACPHQTLSSPEPNDSWRLLSVNHQPVAWFAISDTLRPEAKEVIAALKQQGLSVTLLSGDQQTTTTRIGQQVGIETCIGAATPADKLTYIRQLQSNGDKVMMVGDGINDIPVLAAANISIAMNTASDLAQIHADALLISGNLRHLLNALNKAHKSRRIIQQNIFWALVYNTCALPLAGIGWLTPWMAAIGMSLSSLLVVGNAIRLSCSGQDY